MSSNRKWTFLPLLGLLAAALACNLPLYPIRDAGTIALQQTLAAEAPSRAKPAAPFAGLQTAQPGQAIGQTGRQDAAGYSPVYQTRPGDTLASLAARFETAPERIQSSEALPAEGLLPEGVLVAIPELAGESSPPYALLPDSEVLYSPAAAGFQIDEFIREAGGFLSAYREEVDGELLSGAEIVRRLSLDSSINPRLLLAVLQYRAGWLDGQPRNGQTDYPIGFFTPTHRGLYKELSLTVRQLSLGYYGWRSGTVTRLEFTGGGHLRIHPALNPGTAALQSLFARLLGPAAWREALYGDESFLTFYSARFGDPWQRAQSVEPVIPAGLAQPALELPFTPGRLWSFTGGPHPAWGVASPHGALDFAPVSQRGCGVSDAWVTAPAAGLVVRSENGVLVLDLDGDGFEQTGWAIFFLHIAAQGRVAAGTWVEQDERLGHPSCEGGVASGAHVHIARKYNGEWLPAGQPIPFVLSGWQAQAGQRSYEGVLIKGEQVVASRSDGSRPSSITR